MTAPMCFPDSRSGGGGVCGRRGCSASDREPGEGQGPGGKRLGSGRPIRHMGFTTTVSGEVKVRTGLHHEDAPFEFDDGSARGEVTEEAVEKRTALDAAASVAGPEVGGRRRKALSASHATRAATVAGTAKWQNTPTAARVNSLRPAAPPASELPIGRERGLRNRFVSNPLHFRARCRVRARRDDAQQAVSQRRTPIACHTCRARSLRAHARRTRTLTKQGISQGRPSFFSTAW